MKILHLAEDEKFIDVAINLFESVNPGGNKYIIGLYGSSKNDFIHNKDHIVTACYNTRKYNEVLGNVSEYDLIISHNLFNKYKAKILLKAYPNTKTAVLLWGKEIYEDLYDFRKNIYQNDTKKILSKLNYPFQVILSNYIKNFLSRFNLNYSHNLIKEALIHVHYHGIFVKEDYEKLKKALNIRGDWFWFSYFNIEDTILSHSDYENIIGENILIGNSGAPSNNHIEAFTQLSKQIIKDRKIIVPLNYGNMNYIQEVLKNGYNIFGNNFMPITEFLPLKDYNNLMASCNLIIFNHNRQQGAGNIITGLWMGSRILLNRDNTLYGFFNNLGINVRCLDEPWENINEVTPSELKITREILIRHFSKNNVLSQLQNFLANL